MWIRDYFFRELMPVLTPIGLDPSHPFPRVLNKSLNFAVELSGRDAFGRNSGAAVVQAPRALPRVIRLPEDVAGCDTVVFLSSVCTPRRRTFTGMTVEGATSFASPATPTVRRRGGNQEPAQGAAGELPSAFRRGSAAGSGRQLLGLDAAFCSNNSNSTPMPLPGARPVNLVRLMQVPTGSTPDLKFPPSSRCGAACKDTDSSRRSQGRHPADHPFESSSGDRLHRAGRRDPHVVASADCLPHRHRSSDAGADPCAQSAGSHVVVELMARSTRTPYQWAPSGRGRRHVVYGVVGHKTTPSSRSSSRRTWLRRTRIWHRQLPCPHCALTPTSPV